MKYILIECKQYHELSGEVKKKVKEEVEIMHPELTTREKADLLWTTDGDLVDIVGLKLGELLDGGGLVGAVYEMLDKGQEQVFFNKLTDDQDIEKIVEFVDYQEDLYEALDAKHGKDYHDDVLMCDAATQNLDMELRTILLNIWENKENIKFNKQVEELKFYE